jgi:hypothetical protein
MPAEPARPLGRAWLTIQKGALQSPGYKTIELIEVQIPLSYGPFQQLYEKKGVYELAFNEAMSELHEHEKAVAARSA